MTADLRREPHNDPACTDHPHCPSCGVQLADAPEVIACEDCDTDAPIASPAIVQQRRAA